MKALVSIGSAAGLAICLSMAANASPVTLTYTGQDFTTVGGTYSTSDKVTGTIDLSSPLGDNLSLAQISPTSFSFNDGVQTFTQADTLSTETLEFSTNGSGVITAWRIDLGPGPKGIGIYAISGVGDGGGGGEFDYGYNTVDGSWSMQAASASVPEPLTLSLFGAGLLGAAAMRRRKAHKAA